MNADRARTMGRMGRPVHQRLILPGDVAKRDRLQVYVPRGYETGETIIVGLCRVCGAKFGKGEEAAWQRHVGPCARANLDELRAAGPQEQQAGTVFDEDNWDPEFYEHQRAVGRRMLAEGRLTTKPHER